MTKLSMNERYALLTRDLDWKPTYVDPERVYPYTRYEGIKIHDWDGWDDPFRLTVDTYYKYQAEKDRRLYAVLDGFAQSQGHLGLSDARYLNTMKLFLQAVTPLEYTVHRHFAFLARHLEGPAPGSPPCARASTSCATARPRPTRSPTTTSTTRASTAGRRCTTGCST